MNSTSKAFSNIKMIFEFTNLQYFPELAHAVTTRHFNRRSDFTLADHVGDGAENALCHRQELMGYLGLEFERLTAAQQVHGSRVTLVRDEQWGLGRDGWKTGIAGTDALVTDLADTPLMVLSADCPLILAYDPTQKTLGLIHASWRSTFGGIIGNVVSMMSQCFGSSPSDLVVGIGPGAGPCCYEVDEPFIQTISGRPELLAFIVCRDGKTYFDLWSACRSELVRAGVLADRIEMMGQCTICNDDFYSYRRQGDNAGRFGLIAAIRK